MPNIGKILPTEITTEMEKSYLDYAMSVIVARALPDVRDGLKPVHRRILYAMYEMGLTHISRFVKSAKVVGEVLGKYHPHGDMAVYDSLVRMAQDFSMRYPLISGQGNFGSIDGDPAAAMRYTEVKLATISLEMLLDIEKETADFIPNFDGSLKEPVYLPAKLPNLLLMGSDGIAVGMATKTPPHNLGEVIDALVYLITKTKITALDSEPRTKNQEPRTKNQEPRTKNIFLNSVLSPKSSVKSSFLSPQSLVLSSDVTISELMEHIKGPDFPTAGAIYDISEIKNAYSTGRGKIVMRAKAEIEDIGSGKSAVIVTELPYQVNKANLVKRIAELVKDKKIEGISDLRDESDRHGIRVVVILKRDAKPRKVLNNLFVHTEMQSTFPVNIVALVDGTPQTLNLKTILEEYLKHRHLVITKRSEFELREAKARAHILEGLKIAVDDIDEVISIIKKAKDVSEAKIKLMTKFKLTEVQAQAILDMQLKRLAALERQKIEDELLMTKETIVYLEDLLSHPEKILKVIEKELLKLKEKYADPRRTRIFKSKVGEFAEEDLIPKEPTVITITKSGYIKRQALSAFRLQQRGGKGVIGMTTKIEDKIEQLIYANTHENILFFTNKGKVYQIKVWDLPEGTRISKGQAVVNLINIEQGEFVTSVLTYNPKVIATKKGARENFIFMATKSGTVKKTSLSEYENIRRNGLVAIKLSPADELCWVKLTSGRDEIILVSYNGKSIRFSETQVRPTGRDTMGVRGILLKGKDFVVGMDVINEHNKKLDFLTVMEKGLGKKTPISDFPKQNRGGQGVKVSNVTERTGKVITARIIFENTESLLLTSSIGQVVKLPINSIPKLNRATQGVILMRFSDKNDSIAAATCITKD